MKLATLRDGSRDGRLLIVSRDGTRAVEARAVAPTLQRALDGWSTVAPELRSIYDKLNDGQAPGAFDLDTSKLHSPLPRAYEWIDGSAYINHIVLVRKARGAEPPATLKTEPLVYQGGSGCLLAPTDDIPLVNPEWGLDFEAEIAVIVDDVPMGTKADEAAQYIRLVMICNDITLRNLIPNELKKGFGFFVSKPATAFAPFAVTPDELGDAWSDGRVNRRLCTRYNGELFGDPEAGPEMHFSFLRLIEHITQSRSLTAGTIIGSGTVSNEDINRGHSCLAEKRMVEKIETGEFKTPFMAYGDTVEITMTDDSGRPIFGTISQKVVSANDD